MFHIERRNCFHDVRRALWDIKSRYCHRLCRSDLDTTSLSLMRQKRDRGQWRYSAAAESITRLISWDRHYSVNEHEDDCRYQISVRVLCQVLHICSLCRVHEHNVIFEVTMLIRDTIMEDDKCHRCHDLEHDRDDPEEWLHRVWILVVQYLFHERDVRFISWWKKVRLMRYKFDVFVVLESFAALEDDTVDIDSMSPTNPSVLEISSRDVKLTCSTRPFLQEGRTARKLIYPNIVFQVTSAFDWWFTVRKKFVRWTCTSDDWRLCRFCEISWFTCDDNVLIEWKSKNWDVLYVSSMCKESAGTGQVWTLSEKTICNMTDRVTRSKEHRMNNMSQRGRRDTCRWTDSAYSVTDRI